MKRVQSDANRVFLQMLPLDVLVTLHSFLPYGDVCKCELICKLWRSILSNENEFWLPLFTHRFSWVDLSEQTTYRKAYRLYKRLVDGEATSTILQYHTKTISAAVMHQNQFITGSENETISFLDVDTKTVSTSLEVDYEIRDMTVFQKNLIACEQDQLHIWNIDTKAVVATHEDDFVIRSLASTDQWFISSDVGSMWADENDTVPSPALKLWDLKNDTTTTICEHQSIISKLKLDQDNIVMGYENGTLILYKLTENKVINMVENAHAEPIRSLVIYENLIISCAKDGVKVWDRQTLEAKYSHPLEQAFRIQHTVHLEVFRTLALWGKMVISTSFINKELCAKLWNFRGESRLILQMSPNKSIPVFVYKDQLISAYKDHEVQILE